MNLNLNSLFVVTVLRCYVKAEGGRRHSRAQPLWLCCLSLWGLLERSFGSSPQPVSPWLPRHGSQGSSLGSQPVPEGHGIGLFGCFFCCYD